MLKALRLEWDAVGWMWLSVTLGLLEVKGRKVGTKRGEEQFLSKFKQFQRDLLR